MVTSANWNISATDNSISGRLHEKLQAALTESSSTLAHEPWQPWKFQIRDGFVELSIGNSLKDPSRREEIIRCGMVLQSLKTLLKQHGCLARVRLFPELDQPALIARVQVCENSAPHGREWMPAEALPTPSNFSDADSLGISGTMLNCINHMLGGHRCWLEMAECQKSRERLLSLVEMKEHWLFQMNGGREGLLPTSSTTQRFSLGVKLRLPIATRAVGKETDASSESGTFAVIKTKTDDKHGWIATGQTMGLLLLTANKFGVSCTFHNQTLQKPSIRWDLRTSIGHKGFVQAIVQLKAAYQSALGTFPMNRTPSYTLSSR